jgi:protein-L-isoaspartate O-methyltransferase
MRPDNQVDPTSRDFFESMYAGNADPWHFASSDYELRRYGAILSALRGRRYARALEPGCSIGVLTASLASIADAVEAMDISPSAIEAAKKRCASLRNVHLTCGSLAEAPPHGEFDLMVLSEIGYYFEEMAWREMAERLLAKVPAGGTVLAAHWLGESKDHVMSGDKVHEILAAGPGISLELAERHQGFRLDRWRKL